MFECGGNSEKLILMSISNISSSSSTLANMENAVSPAPSKCTPPRHSTVFNVAIDKSPISPKSPMSVDVTFEPTVDMMVNDFDDEQTLNEEEALANLEEQNPEDEIATLKEESEMPIELLLAKYGSIPPTTSVVAAISRKRPRKQTSSKKKRDHGIMSEIKTVEQLPDAQTISAKSAVVNGETDELIQNVDKENNFAKHIDANEYDEIVSISEELTHISTETQASIHSSTIKVLSTCSHLLDLYNDCYDDDQPETERNDGKYLPLEMLYDDVDDEVEDEDADTESDDMKKTIMVGACFQADIPAGLSQYGDVLPYENEDKLIWEPSQVTEADVEEYLIKVHEIKQLTNAVEDESATTTLQDDANELITSCSGEDKPKSNQETQNDIKISTITTGSDTTEPTPVVKDNEQALHLLVQCGYDFKEALRRQRLNVLPLSDGMSSWSEEECQKFEEGIQKYGKDFLKMRQNLVRTRTMRELVQFYYLWKKSERRDKKFSNADTVDQMDGYINESGDYNGNGISNNSVPSAINANCASSVAGLKRSTAIAKSYSIMIGNNQQEAISKSNSNRGKLTDEVNDKDALK